MCACACVRLSLQLPGECFPYFTPPHHPFHSSCFAESADVSEKPLDAEREKELRAEEVGTDGGDPASPLGPELRGFSTGKPSPPWELAHGVCWGDRGAQDLSLGCDFSFLLYDRSIELPRLPGKQRMHFLSKVE